MTSLYDQADVNSRLRPTQLECKVKCCDFKLKQVILYSTLAAYTNHSRVVFRSLLQAGTLFQLMPQRPG